MLVEGIEFRYPQNINVVSQVATIANEQRFFQTEVPDLNTSVLLGLCNWDLLLDSNNLKPLSLFKLSHMSDMQQLKPDSIFHICSSTILSFFFNQIFYAMSSILLHLTRFCSFVE